MKSIGGSGILSIRARFSEAIQYREKDLPFLSVLEDELDQRLCLHFAFFFYRYTTAGLIYDLPVVPQRVPDCEVCRFVDRFVLYLLRLFTLMHNN
jgi:hypothetical protein